MYPNMLLDLFLEKFLELHLLTDIVVLLSAAVPYIRDNVQRLIKAYLILKNLYGSY